jgi:hypothetical protein
MELCGRNEDGLRKIEVVLIPRPGRPQPGMAEPKISEDISTAHLLPRSFLGAAALNVWIHHAHHF